MNTADLEDFDNLLEGLDAFDLGDEFGFEGWKKKKWFPFLKKDNKIIIVIFLFIDLSI